MIRCFILSLELIVIHLDYCIVTHLIIVLTSPTDYESAYMCAIVSLNTQC